MRVTMFDYGAGNLHSLQKALAAAGADVRTESDPFACLDAHALVLPGVGAFAPAAARLATARAAMGAAIADGLPVIGICLGMQLLFDTSEEGEGAGLGVMPGRIERLRAARVPQMGWNALTDVAEPLMRRAPLDWVYYANSYVARPVDDGCVTAWSELDGCRFPAIVRRGRVLGVQFHPEKSSRAGIAFLAAALEECAA
jgi:imidazole glycerol-phosphate synthase subunit HisH